MDMAILMRPNFKVKARLSKPEYEKLKKLIRERDKTCQAQNLTPTIRCWSALEVDHKIGRGRGGKDIEDNLWLLCHLHHQFKTGNPYFATVLRMNGDRAFEVENPSLNEVDVALAALYDFMQRNNR
mgnify:CR=1 FL=1